MYLGLLLRLALSGLFFATAYYALYPQHITSMCQQLADRLDRPHTAFDRVADYINKRLLRLRQVFYGFSALFLLFSGLFLYHHLRRLEIKEDPTYQSRPYSQPSGRAPGAGTQPYGGNR